MMTVYKIFLSIWFCWATLKTVSAFDVLMVIGRYVINNAFSMHDTPFITEMFFIITTQKNTDLATLTIQIKCIISNISIIIPDNRITDFSTLFQVVDIMIMLAMLILN